MSPDKPADPETQTHVYRYNALKTAHATAINAILTPYALARHMSIPVHLNEARKPTHALLDSGVMGNFIHEELVE
jgi:hypothetical protein